MQRIKRRLGGLGVVLAVLGGSLALAACAPAASHCEWNGASVPGDNTITQSIGNGGTANVSIQPASHVTYDGVDYLNGNSGDAQVDYMTIDGTATQACLSHWYTLGITLAQPSFVVRNTDAWGVTLASAHGTTGSDSRFYHDWLHGQFIDDPAPGQCIHTNVTGVTSLEESLASCGSDKFAFGGNLGTGSGQGWDIEHSYVAAGGFIDSASTQAGLIVDNYVLANCSGLLSTQDCINYLTFVIANHGFDPPANTNTSNCKDNVVAVVAGTVPQGLKDAWNAKCANTTFVDSTNKATALDTWAYGRQWYHDITTLQGGAPNSDPYFARGPWS